MNHLLQIPPDRPRRRDQPVYQKQSEGVKNFGVVGMLGRIQADRDG